MFKEKIVEILEKIKTDIQVNMDVAKITATGKSKESLKVVAYGDGVKLISTFEFFSVVETGRDAGKAPPIDPLVEWIKARGLEKETDKKTEGFAYAISKTIEKEGYGRPTPPHKPFGSTISNIYSDLLHSYIPTFKNNIVSMIKLNVKDK